MRAVRGPRASSWRWTICKCSWRTLARVDLGILDDWTGAAQRRTAPRSSGGREDRYDAPFPILSQPSADRALVRGHGDQRLPTHPRRIIHNAYRINSRARSCAAQAATPNPTPRKPVKEGPTKHNRIRITPAKFAEMTAVRNHPPAPVGHQGPSPRATPRQLQGTPRRARVPPLTTGRPLAVRGTCSFRSCFPRLPRSKNNNNIFSNPDAAMCRLSDRNMAGLQIVNGWRWTMECMAASSEIRTFESASRHIE